MSGECVSVCKTDGNWIERSQHDAEVSRLKGELACYRARYPGWAYNPIGKYLFSVGDHEPCLEGE